jgi:hypothetical protein
MGGDDDEEEDDLASALASVQLSPEKTRADGAGPPLKAVTQVGIAVVFA